MPWTQRSASDELPSTSESSSSSVLRPTVTVQTRADAVNEETLLKMKDAGFSNLAFGSESFNDEILEDYPFLEPEDIAAALTYAARQTDHIVLAAAT